MHDRIEARIPDAYYGERPEVTALVPPEARYVIDIGCGAGAIGRALKAERPGIAVRGVEPHPDSAASARMVLDDVLNAGAEHALPEGWPEADCLIFADVLEHMADPWTCLKTWRNRLAPHGSIVVSIPNVVHYATVWEHLCGHWNYQDSGILDRTHLRFFTRNTAVALLEETGFTIKKMVRNWRMPNGLHSTSPWLERWDRIGWNPDEPLPPRATRVADYLTLQYLMVATPSPKNALSI
jgi:2-polyprenyl-3-methyl-5-hydroxy-6-metoxy-1,4-benzoquinol methylase